MHFLQNYIKRTSGFVENQLGPQFAAALSELPASPQWQGPVPSSSGYHLVLISQRQPRHLPPLAQIKDEVREDMMRDRVADYREKAIKDLIGRYTVQRE